MSPKHYGRMWDEPYIVAYIIRSSSASKSSNNSTLVNFIKLKFLCWNFLACICCVKILKVN
jgi:hypothetical protein